MQLLMNQWSPMAAKGNIPKGIFLQKKVWNPNLTTSWVQLPIYRKHCTSSFVFSHKKKEEKYIETLDLKIPKRYIKQSDYIDLVLTLILLLKIKDSFILKRTIMTFMKQLRGKDLMIYLKLTFSFNYVHFVCPVLPNLILLDKEHRIKKEN